MYIVSKNTGDSLAASEFDQIISELEEVITAAGIAASAADVQQITKAVIGLVSAGEYYNDTGAANAYTLAAIAPRLAPAGLIDGMKVRFIAGHTNTGASTMNLAGLGNLSVARGNAAGGALMANDITAGMIVSLTYNQAGNVWVLTQLPAAAGITLATNSQSNAGTGGVALQPSNFSQQSLSGNGYQRLPSGLIFQWGGVAGSDLGGDESLTATFPISYPNAGLIVIPQGEVTGGFNISCMINGNSLSTTGFTGTLDEASAVVQSGVYIRYISIGF